MTKERTHVISMLVEDQPGVLTRIAGMFARRGFNIDTITVGKTTKKGISKMVISVIGDDYILEQVEKQVNKLIDTIKVTEMPPEKSVIRELCLLKIAIPNKKAKEDILRYTKNPEIGYCRAYRGSCQDRCIYRPYETVWNKRGFKDRGNCCIKRLK